jgi:hypothetical protein
VAVGIHRPGISRELKVPVGHEGGAYTGLHIRSMGGASRET